MTKVILTESQFISLLNEERMYEILSESTSLDDIKVKIKRAITAGVAVAVIVAAISKMAINNAEKQELLNMVETEQVEKQQEWRLISDDTTATIYNAVPSQCNKDVGHTASMFRLNLSDVLSHKIIAMERTMMAELGLEYGDVVKIDGADIWDGIWQIQDTMNKKFAGQHKIDILLPKSAGLGKWDNVRIFALVNPAETELFKYDMAPQLSKTDFAKQQDLIDRGLFKTK